MKLRPGAINSYGNRQQQHDLPNTAHSPRPSPYLLIIPCVKNKTLMLYHQTTPEKKKFNSRTSVLASLLLPSSLSFSPSPAVRNVGGVTGRARGRGGVWRSVAARCGDTPLRNDIRPKFGQNAELCSMALSTPSLLPPSPPPRSPRRDRKGDTPLGLYGCGVVRV